jgi:hypothetical protein
MRRDCSLHDDGGAGLLYLPTNQKSEGRAPKRKGATTRKGRQNRGRDPSKSVEKDR